MVKPPGVPCQCDNCRLGASWAHQHVDRVRKLFLSKL